MKLEVIVFDKETMIAAQEGGATQVELIKDLDQDGLSPDLETVKEVMEVATIPVHVMVRHSNTFQHSDKEVKEMIKYIKELAKLNVPAIVYGSLDEENKVNEKQLQKVLKVTNKLGMKLIHHRAADFARCTVEA
jgi:copper homeostasis protein